MFLPIKTLDKMYGFYLSKPSIKCMVLTHFIFPTLSHKAPAAANDKLSDLNVSDVAASQPLPNLIQRSSEAVDAREKSSRVDACCGTDEHWTFLHPSVVPYLTK